MKVLLLDVVHDLRSKRLWPVALALAVAIVLAPIVLLVVAAPDEPESSPAAPIAAVPQGAAAKVDVSTRSPGEGTDLDAFEPHNPFRPKGGPVREGDGGGSSEDSPTGGPGTGEATPADGGGAAVPQPAPSESSGGGSSSADGGSGGGSGSGADADAEAGGSGSGADEPADAKDDGSGSTKASPATPRRDARLALLSYDVRAAYGRAGEVRSRVLEPLQVFPSNRRMFMLSGVDSRRKEAIFSVLDASLTAQSGQGRCLHVGGRCTVLRLRDGQSRRFRDESGETWVLRLGRLEPVRDLVDVDKADDELRELIESLGG